MTRCPSRLRRWRRRADTGGTAAPADLTRPHVVVRDGVPIAHEGPPGFPGRVERDETDEGQG